MFPDSQKKRTLKRPRKSQEQIDALWRIYKQYNGLVPSRNEVKMISEAIGLKPAQITKWLWDTEKKIEKDKALAN